MDKARIYQQSQRLASYALLPGIVPRIRTATSTPFATLAGLFAEIVGMAGLLPRDHAYLQVENIGQFGLLDVLRAAGAHLTFDLRHIDQIIVYFAILSAFVTIWCFFALAVAYALMTPSFAATDVTSNLGSLMSNIYSYTTTANPDRDAALMLLDRTLGVLGNTPSGTFFGSAVATMCPGGDLGKAADPNCIRAPFPSAFNTATLNLLQFYSTAIFMFAILFFLYLIMTVVMEVAIKGKPFGERFNAFWTPIRLVVGIGLMIPLAPQGLNSGQYIVLYTAKISSAFATNGWLYYHNWLGNNALMGADRNPIGMGNYRWDSDSGQSIQTSSPLAAKLNAPDVSEIVRFFHLVASCEYFYESNNPGMNVQGYFSAPGKAVRPAYREPDLQGGPTSGGAPAESFVSYEDALQYYKNGTIRVIFGAYDPLKYTDTGGLKKLCGELDIPVSSVKNPQTGAVTNPGAAAASMYYYNYTMGLWDKTTWIRQLMDGFAAQMIRNYSVTGPNTGCEDDKFYDKYETPDKQIRHSPDGTELTPLGPCRLEPHWSYMKYQIEMFQSIFQILIQKANEELAKPENFKIDDKVLNRGWAGAGIWFQNIALMNGAYVTAVQDMPYGKDRPVVMDKLRNQILQAKPNVQNPEVFCGMPEDAGKSLNAQDMQLATALCKINIYLKNDANDLCFMPNANGPMSTSGMNGYTPSKCAKTVDNVMMRVINTMFGTQFIFRFEDNAETHPLTQLVTFGRSLLETSARNLLTGSAIAAAGGVTSLGNEDMGSSLKKIGNFFGTVASLMFSAGFMLYYVLPMLPFVYFFFAMLSWVKAVFEALIGAPLWAAAHLYLGDPGKVALIPPKAMGGYTLLLEILLRPIITVFALIAAMGIFSAVVLMIHELLQPMLINLGRPELAQNLYGEDGPQNMKDLIDRFFFTILYILMMYMTATSCFKLIDTIPNKFMRGGGWFAAAKSFANVARDSPAERFTSNSYVAIANPLQKLIDGADEMSAEWSKMTAEVTNKDFFANMAQQVFGKDRKTRAGESIKGAIEGMTKTESTMRKELKKQKAALEKMDANDPNRSAKEKEIKEIQKIIAINNADKILMEVMKPGSSGIDRSALDPDQLKMLEDNIKIMEDEMKKTRPLVWEMMQSQMESVEGGRQPKGTYVNNAAVQKTLQNFVAQQRKAWRIEMKKNGIGE